MVSFTKRSFFTATLGLFALRACATSDILTGEIQARDADNSTLAKRGDDCDLAQYFYAEVDCYYDFDQGGNFLNYVVKITPTGQANDNSGWCKGILDNMIGDCGRNPSDNRQKGNTDWAHCDDYLTYNIHHPKTKQIVASKGIDLNFHYLWPWTEGEDAVGCISSAITKATGSCAGAVSFKNGKCYKR